MINQTIYALAVNLLVMIALGLNQLNVLLALMESFYIKTNVFLSVLMIILLIKLIMYAAYVMFLVILAMVLIKIIVWVVKLLI